MRSMTVGRSTPDSRAISPSGSGWKPWILSSEIGEDAGVDRILNLDGNGGGGHGWFGV